MIFFKKVTIGTSLIYFIRTNKRRCGLHGILCIIESSLGIDAQIWVINIGCNSIVWLTNQRICWVFIALYKRLQFFSVKFKISIAHGSFELKLLVYFLLRSQILLVLDLCHFLPYFLISLFLLDPPLIFLSHHDFMSPISILLKHISIFFLYLLIQVTL